MLFSFPSEFSVVEFIWGLWSPVNGFIDKRTAGKSSWFLTICILIYSSVGYWKVLGVPREAVAAVPSSFAFPSLFCNISLPCPNFSWIISSLHFNVEKLGKKNSQTVPEDGEERNSQWSNPLCYWKYEITSPNRKLSPLSPSWFWD